MKAQAVLSVEHTSLNFSQALQSTTVSHYRKAHIPPPIYQILYKNTGLLAQNHPWFISALTTSVTNTFEIF